MSGYRKAGAAGDPHRHAGASGRHAARRGQPRRVRGQGRHAVDHRHDAGAVRRPDAGPGLQGREGRARPRSRPSIAVSTDEDAAHEAEVPRRPRQSRKTVEPQPGDDSRFPRGPVFDAAQDAEPGAITDAARDRRQPRSPRRVGPDATEMPRRARRSPRSRASQRPMIRSRRSPRKTLPIGTAPDADLAGPRPRPSTPSPGLAIAATAIAAAQGQGQRSWRARRARAARAARRRRGKGGPKGGGKPQAGKDGHKSHRGRPPPKKRPHRPRQPLRRGAHGVQGQVLSAGNRKRSGKAPRSTNGSGRRGSSRRAASRPRSCRAGRAGERRTGRQSPRCGRAGRRADLSAGPRRPGGAHPRARRTRRGPAPEAQALYDDLAPPQPRTRRARKPQVEAGGRPTKKARRDDGQDARSKPGRCA